MSSSTGSPDGSRPRRRADDEAGFTLLETIVAFTVAALIMTALFQLMSRDAEAVARIDDVTRATLAAEAKLEAMGIVEPLVIGVSAGRIDERFSWHTRVEASGIPRLYRVQIAVSWDRGMNERSVSLEGLRLQ